MKAIVVSDVHIAGFKADFDGQVACNCTILKGRVKRGPGKGQPTYRVCNYGMLGLFQGSAFVSEEGMMVVEGCRDSLMSAPRTITDPKVAAALSRECGKFTDLYGGKGVISVE